MPEALDPLPPSMEPLMEMIVDLKRQNEEVRLRGESMQLRWVFSREETREHGRIKSKSKITYWSKWGYGKVKGGWKDGGLNLIWSQLGWV